MIYTPDYCIDNFIKEDVPYIDLTTWVLGIGNKRGIIKFYARDNAVICGTEEVFKIFKKLNISMQKYSPTGMAVKANQVFIEAEGKAEDLHMAWKVSLNIIEHCSGIATRTRAIVNKAKAINPKVEIVTTRKVFPGTKELATKAVVAGGAFPHRLGLSETILIFKHHLKFLGGIEKFIKVINEIKLKACEKKIIVEVDNIQDATTLCRAGVDGIQFDKVPIKPLKSYVKILRAINPKMIIIGTGGIDEQNVEEYARTMVDVIATTSVYFGKPVDIGVKITEV